MTEQLASTSRDLANASTLPPPSGRCHRRTCRRPRHHQQHLRGGPRHGLERNPVAPRRAQTTFESGIDRVQDAFSEASATTNADQRPASSRKPPAGGPHRQGLHRVLGNRQCLGAEPAWPRRNLHPPVPRSRGSVSQATSDESQREFAATMEGPTPTSPTNLVSATATSGKTQGDIQNRFASTLQTNNRTLVSS